MTAPKKPRTKAATKNTVPSAADFVGAVDAVFAEEKAEKNSQADAMSDERSTTHDMYANPMLGKSPLRAAKVLANAFSEAKKTGRPTAYDPAFDELAMKMCMLGAVDVELADFFHITEQTLHNWKSSNPTFLESLIAGKDVADAEIANALYHRAKGYSHPEVNVSNYQGVVTLTPLVKHYPPDTGAAGLWLKNRQGARWRDKVEHEIAGKNGGPIQHAYDLSDEALLAIAAKARTDADA